GRGQHIAVAVNQVQSPVLAGVGQWLIASVNYGAIVLHPLEEIVLDIIRALADLEKGRFLALHHFTAEPRRPDRSNPTRSGEKDAQCKESQQREHVSLVQRRLAVQRIIFVATKRGAGVVIDVVADEADLVLQTQRVDRLL